MLSAPFCRSTTLLPMRPETVPAEHKTHRELHVTRKRSNVGGADGAIVAAAEDTGLSHWRDEWWRCNPVLKAKTRGEGESTIAHADAVVAILHGHLRACHKARNHAAQGVGLRSAGHVDVADIVGGHGCPG